MKNTGHNNKFSTNNSPQNTLKSKQNPTKNINSDDTSNSNTSSNDVKDSNINNLDNQNDNNLSQLNNSFARKSDAINQLSTYIKFYIDEKKHGYKYNHNKILSNDKISETLKNEYNQFHDDLMIKMQELRYEKNNKESFNKKLQPGYFSNQTEEEFNKSQELISDIEKINQKKEEIKNIILLYQLILLKDYEKIKQLFENNFIKYYDGSNIDYLNISIENSDNHEIIEFFKVKKYNEIINNYQELQNTYYTNTIDFLQYLADNNFNNFGNYLFLNSEYYRIEILNNFINNHFWINIYAQEHFQTFVYNFYQYFQNNCNYPQIPYWGEVILSSTDNLENSELQTIIQNYFSDKSAIQVILNKIDTWIQSNNEITDTRYNLIYNFHNYLSKTQEAEECDPAISESLKKINSFLSDSKYSKYTTSKKLEFSDENDLSDIKLNDITRNNQYEYTNFEISQKLNITSEKKTQTTAQNTDVQQIQTEQIKKLTYQYYNSSIKLKKDKKHNQDSKDDKKIDDNKNSGNEKSNYDKVSYFVSGAGLTIFIGFELFLMWSTYFYWTQQREILKIIEKVKKDIDSLLQKDISLLPLILQNKLKSIFTNIFDDEKNDKEKNQEEEEKLIFDKPIYHADIKNNSVMIKTPEIVDQIIEAPCYISMLDSHRIHLPKIALPFSQNNPLNIDYDREVEFNIENIIL